MACIIGLSILCFVASTMSQSLTDLLKTRSDLSIWYRLIEPEWETLDGYNNITFFAPNNDAMTKYFNSDQVSGCASTNTTVLKALTSYHTLQQAYQYFPGQSYFWTQLVDTYYSCETQPIGATYVESTIPYNVADPSDSYINVSSLVSGLNTVSNILGQPIQFSNGVLYVIDTVFQLPANTSVTLSAAGYTAFLGSIIATGTEEIANSQQINLNVPTNEAFQEVGFDLVSLTMIDLSDLVFYHMQNGTLSTGNGFLPPTAPTLEGTNVTNSNSTDWLVYANNALTDPYQYFFSSDSNNIYVIEEVLNPKNTTAPYNSTSWPNPSKVAYVPFASLVTYPNIPLCEKPDWFESVLHPTSKTNVGAIAGGVVGGVVGLALVALGIFLVLRRRRTRKEALRQELDAAETGKSELGSRDHDAAEVGSGEKVELDAKQRHEMESAEKHELDTKHDVPPESPEAQELEAEEQPKKEEHAVYELPAGDDVPKDIFSPVSALSPRDKV